jgi:hypothetical protein
MWVRLLQSVVQRFMRFCEKTFIVIPAYATFFIHHAVALAAIDGDFVRNIPSRHRNFDFLYAPFGYMRSRYSRFSACSSISPYDLCHLFLPALSTHVRLCYLSCYLAESASAAPS